MNELEENLEDRCMKVLESKGGMALKLAPRGLRGFPDRTVLMPGASIWFIEFKRPSGGVTSIQQKKWAKDLRALGFSVYLISSDKEFHDAVKDQE